MGSNRFALLFWGAAYFAWDFLVQKIPFSEAAIIQGILNGPYTQLWYLYVLVGLYLLTPILRIIIAHADQTLIKYFVILWVVGVAIIPFFGLFTTYELNSNVFAIIGYVGFFVLGTYLIHGTNAPLNSLDFYDSWNSFDCNWHLRTGCYCWRNGNVLLPTVF